MKIKPESRSQSTEGSVLEIKIANSSKSLSAMVAKWILKNFFIGRPPSFIYLHSTPNEWDLQAK